MYEWSNGDWTNRTSFNQINVLTMFLKYKQILILLLLLWLWSLDYKIILNMYLDNTSSYI